VFGCVRAVFGEVAEFGADNGIDPCKSESRRADSNRGPLLHEEGPLVKWTVVEPYGPRLRFVGG